MDESEPLSPEDSDAEVEALLDFEPVERHTRRHDGWPPERQRGFVAALATLGNVDRAAHSQGRTASGAWKVRTSAGAEGFADAWDGALALYHRRNPRAAPKGRPSRGEIRAGSGRAWPEAPPAPPPGWVDPSVHYLTPREFIDGILKKYWLKLGQERQARLEGRIVEADFYVRQLTWLEVAVDLGGNSVELLEALQRGGMDSTSIAGTPMSVLLDRFRRAYWAEKDEPERPLLGDLGQPSGDFSTGAPMHRDYRSDRDGPDMNAHYRRQDAACVLAAEAQKAWEEKAKADAEGLEGEGRREWRPERHGGPAMKFFIPLADDPGFAEQVWAGVRLWLDELGLPTTRRRIRALAWSGGDEDHFVAVGGDTPDGEDFVMVILEASNMDLFYVCTPSRGMLDDIPYPLALNDDWRVIDFDEEVVGWA